MFMRYLAILGLLLSSAAIGHAASLEDQLNAVTWRNREVFSQKDLIERGRERDSRMKKPVEDYIRHPHNDAEVDWNANLRANLEGSFRSPYPLDEPTVDDLTVNRFVSVLLTDFDEQGRIHANGDIVKTWESSTDFMWERLVIRNDAKWSDGQAFTAEDFEFSFNAMKTEWIPHVYTGAVGSIASVTAIDKYTLIVNYKNPSSLNEMRLGFRPLPKHIHETRFNKDFTELFEIKNSDLSKEEKGNRSAPIVKKLGEYLFEQARNQPVSVGPYRIRPILTTGEDLMLDRNDAWYEGGIRQKPYFKTIRFRFIKDETAKLAVDNNDLDFLYVGVVDFAAAKRMGMDLNFAKGSTSMYHTIRWNMTTPFFSDRRVRQAMAYAIDYEELLGGEGKDLYERAYGPFPRSFWRAAKTKAEPYKLDLDKAEDLLEEAGWILEDGDQYRSKRINGQKVVFKFEMICAPLAFSYVAMMKKDFFNIGIDMHPHADSTLQNKIRSGEYQAAVSGWLLSSGSLAEEFTTGKDFNFSVYSNPKVDALFEQIKKTAEKEKQQELYGEMFDLVFEDQPRAIIRYRPELNLLRKDIHGFRRGEADIRFFADGLLSIWKKAQN